MLSGKMTRIRPLDGSDLDLLYDWYNDHDFSYWASGNWPYAAMLRREELEQKMYAEDDHRYAITDLEGNLIGTIGFDQVNIPARSARLFIGIGVKQAWGHGYGSDALTTFIGYLFKQWNFRRLTAEPSQDNNRALACYQKLGFVVEGRLREAYYIGGKYYDAVILGLLKRDFAQ
jgi:RimJ/RimL family protein N-acetyltransferase